MAQMDELRCQSKNTQVATGIHDSAIERRCAFQSFDRAIDCETLGDSAKINNQRADEIETVQFLSKKNVAPVAPRSHPVPCAEDNSTAPVAGDRDVENAVAFMRQTPVPPRKTCHVQGSTRTLFGNASRFIRETSLCGS